jgi:hypothetical protein
MVLKGSIGTFDVISIIQMVTSQQVTGVLHIKGQNKKDAFEIFIENGMIIRAIPMMRMPALYMAERLQKAGLLNTGQYKILINEIKKGNITEADIPKRFSVPASAIKRLAVAITYESLHIMYGMKAGTYEFEQKPLNYNKELFTPMNTEFVLMESSRILDEVSHGVWKYDDEQIFKKVVVSKHEENSPAETGYDKKRVNPEEDFVIERTTTPIVPDQEEEKKPPEGTYSSSEDTVLELVDGRRTFKDIYYASLLNKNEVILELGKLINIGKVVPLSPVQRQFISKRSTVIERLVSGIRALMIFLINMAIIIMIFYYSRINPFNNYYTAKGEITYSNLLKYIGHYQQIKLANALEIYKLENGNYPAKLKSLVDKHILDGKDLTFPYGNEYYYSVQDDTYILIAPKYVAK